jgi:hypothetical protein
MEEKQSMDNNEAQESNEAQEDDGFIIRKLVKEVNETNRKIEEAYDEKLRRLDAKKKLLPDEKSEEMHQTRITRLNEALKELKSRISDARKAGKDPLIADLVLRNANAKIKMAEVTHEQRDFDEVEQILKRAESELEEALKEEELDVKKDIIQKLRERVAKETGKVIED